MSSEFQEHYASLTDDELLHIASDRKALREDAALALDAEMSRRGLTDKQARSKKRDEVRLEIEELRPHRSKRKKSKYFVARINFRAFLIGMAGQVILMFLVFGHHGIREEWKIPILVIYVGVLLACLAVQPWVRRTPNFWIAIAAGCVPQLFVSHWLTVYHPARTRSAFKGSGNLSLIAGYVVAWVVFVLLQKLWPAANTPNDSKEAG